MKEKLIIALLKEAEDGSMASNETHEMKRSEAIERMAKAAKKAYRGYFYTEPHHPNISDIMEAALNALLEGHDDER